MKDTFIQGIAFILEGDTEKYFYTNLLRYLCKKHEGATIIDLKDETFDEKHIIEHNDSKTLICMHNVGTITQITSSEHWFNNRCANQYSSKMPWTVFLCYDTDSHNSDVSKFFEGDWKDLRAKIMRRKNIKIIDSAASADIEDIFLTDLKSISKFLNIKPDLTIEDLPAGIKGKAKLKKLFRSHDKVYHEGRRAEELIKSLDMQYLIDSNVLALKQIELSIFEK